MHKHDFDDFAALLGDVWGLKGQALTGGQKAMFFRALAAYPLEEVRAGLDAHIKHPDRGRFLPMPADVVAQINGMVADDGRPGAEEAWATVFLARDEDATIVWTEEMSVAFGVARPLLLAGDEIAARMAFKESYTRLVTAARDKRYPVKWSATLGFDITGRDAALLPHVRAGRISAEVLAGTSIGLDAMVALPAPEGASETNLAARAKAREKLAVYRAEAASRKDAPTVTEVARQRTHALKAEAAAKVRNYTDTQITLNSTGAQP